MNRAQKRQQAALERRKQRISTNGRTIAHYRDTATLWARGAVLTGRHIDGELDGEWTFARMCQRTSTSRWPSMRPMRRFGGISLRM